MDRLNDVLYTLKHISVSGLENMRMMIGCITELEKIIGEGENNDQHQNGERADA